ETVNGTQVVSADQLVIIAATTPAITSVTTSVKPGGLMTITGKNLNYVESIIFPTNVKAVLYGVRSENTIEVYVPETAKKGTTTFTMNSFDGKEIVSPTFTISGTDPVVDASYVFFNFDGKNSWWGDKGAVENLAEYSLDGSSYFRINDNMNPWWTGLFWRNGKNDLKTDGVTVAGWSVKMDVNVIEASTGDFKFRFKGTEGDFWAVIPGFAAKGGWYTVTIPLTSFNDAGKLMVDMSTMDSDFGMAYAGPGEHVNMCIDNIRFEQTSGPSGVLRLY
ncbi:MAG: glycan-binding surface protein, partial [Paludibacter sp.]